MKKNKKKGYVLLMTILITLFISAVSLVAFTCVYRYSALIEKNQTQLREEVK